MKPQIDIDLLTSVYEDQTEEEIIFLILTLLEAL